jgi:hypothetical protein
MKALSKFTLLLLLLLFVATGWSQSNDPSMRAYNGIDGWNPCTNEQWFVEQQGDNQLGNKFISPFLKTSGISPGTPEENFKEVCTEGQTLKPDWES